MKLLIFRSADQGRDYDRFVGVDDGVSLGDAMKLADEIVARVKEQSDCGVDWNEIEMALEAAGFILLMGWQHCDEEC